MIPQKNKQQNYYCNLYLIGFLKVSDEYHIRSQSKQPFKKKIVEKINIENEQKL